MSKFKIPCVCERTKGKIVCSVENRLDNHHPLTLEQIEQMLQALCAGDWQDYVGGEGQMTANIQCRLVQAIPGMVCPNPDFDPIISPKITALNEAYVDGLEAREDINSLALKLFNIINQRRF